MSDARLDAERLAMLLEGRLSPGERDRLLADLAADPDAAADLAAAAAALGATTNLRTAELETSAGLASAPGGARAPADRPMPSVWRRHMPLLAAASLLVAAAIGTGIWRVTRVPPVERTFAVVAGVRPSGALPDDWTDAPWARTRGGTAGSRVPALSAMLGARMADLELARRIAPDRVQQVASAASAIARQIPGSGPALVQWEAAASRPSGDGLAEARADLERLVEPAPYEAGAVLEGMRLALLAGDDAALGALSDRLAILARSPSLPPSFGAEAARLAGMLGAEATTARNREERLRAVDAVFRVLLG